MKAVTSCLVVLAIVTLCSGYYQLDRSEQKPYGLQAFLSLVDETHGPFSGDIQNLVLDSMFYDANTVRIRIRDAKNARWEVPYVNKLADPTAMPKDMNVAVSFCQSGPFCFVVTRIATGEVLFNSSRSSSVGDMVYEDQYLQLSTQFKSGDSPNIYGLGERVHSLRLSVNQTYTIFARDQGTPPDRNLYGSHPFYLQVLPGGNAHGVFMLNSNAMDVVLTPSDLTFKMVGGIIDLWVFNGPTPDAAVTQYQTVIGFPHFPPYWSLGFHQCRWGYKQLSDVESVVEQYAAHNLPLDTMWTDIDYMDGYRDFTFDPTRYPADQMRAFVEKLHSNGMHYIPITDPGVKTDTQYAVYNRLLASGAFVRDAAGQPFRGKVWPGAVLFPDFTNQVAFDFWLQSLQDFHALVPVDGLWIDMNELSNFCDGECPEESSSARETVASGKPMRELNGFDPNNPPYTPGGDALKTKTLSMDAQHNTSIEYNVHNLAGYLEGWATQIAMEKIRGTRSVVISRSTFAGSGYHNGHWLGDNYSTFESMAASVAGLLNFQFFGMPLVGADICGFGGDTTEELCTRWMQLGAFYPFSRNHNSIGQKSQEPYVFSPATVDIMRTALNTRYTLIPFFYTMFAQAHHEGVMVTRPLFAVFPLDSNTYGIDSQFMWGDALLVSPVLTQGATSVNAYLPKAIWYDWFNQTAIVSSGASFTLDAPIERINVHQRGGSVIVTQGAALTTTAARNTPYGITAAIDETGNAMGFLYADDGETVEAPYSIVFFNATVGASAGQVTSQLWGPGWTDLAKQSVGSVTVAGLPFTVRSVSAQGKPVTTFTYNAATKALYVTGLSVQASEALDVSFSA